MRKMLLLLFAIGFFTIQACTQTEPGGAAQKLPDGVSLSEHRYIAPDGGEIDQTRIEPPFWWVGMADPELEILIYDQDIRDFQPTIEYPGVTIQKVTRLENPNYLFVLLRIDPSASPGKLDIRLEKETEMRSFPYEIRSRAQSKKRLGPLTAADFVYLLMPDRFSNGNPENDSFEDMNQNGVDRSKMYFRHGGDIQGIQNHLDYLKELSVTALWPNPMLENDQPYESYHGYAITDFYQIDKRFGSNEDFLNLVDQCHEKGIKMIMDIVHNHVGDQHWFIRDLPAADWIHQFPEYTRTSYRAPTLMDPYASEADKNRMSNAWFDHHMPDLNQQHEQLANYLIQNNVWWVEYAGLDAYRIDTYAYPDQDFMARLGKRLQDEFPDFSFFGETWVHGKAVQAQFTQNNQLRKGYNSYLPGITDFQLHYAINESLSREQGWTDGVSRLYYTLAQDFLYEDPYRNVIFLDNHDLSRFFSVVGEDLDKYKSGIALLMTLRGIPMIYYGTEILMKNFTDPDGLVRLDFPGGWEGDPVDKFKPEGRKPKEQEAFDYVKRLAAFRAKTPALQEGQLTQFVPENNLYVFFRHDANTRVMVAMNASGKPMEVKTERFGELLDGYNRAIEVGSGNTLDQLDRFEMPAHSVWVLQLLQD